MKQKNQHALVHYMWRSGAAWLRDRDQHQGFSPPLAGLIERLLERLMVKPCQTLYLKMAHEEKPGEAPPFPLSGFFRR